MPASPVVRLVAHASPRPDPVRHRVEVDVVLVAELADGGTIDVQHHGFGVAIGTFGGAVIEDGEVPPVTERDVRNVLIPEDDADPEPLPWAWHAAELTKRGHPTTAEELRAVPYDVVIAEPS